MHIKVVRKTFKTGKNAWFAFIQKLRKILNIKDEVIYYGKQKFEPVVIKPFYIILKKKWYISQQSYTDGKLSTHVKLKQTWD